MDRRLPNTGRKLPVPPDGVSLSNRPKSWLGIAWNSILTSLGREHSARLAKGRGLARAGRVRDLWFSPGIVHAEVHDDQNYQVSLRVAVLEEEAWRTIVALLGKHLHLVASLLEGILSSRFLKMLEAHDLQLMPLASEIHGDCNCSDYHSLCPHMAAVHLVLADALDGDPFLMLNLRGRSQQQLLSALRRKWGDSTSVKARDSAAGLPLPEDPESWFTSPDTEVFSMRFTIRKPAEPTLIGLKALGPPPGKADLHTALEPMYRHGSHAAEKLALTSTNNDLKPRKQLETALKNLGELSEDDLIRILGREKQAIQTYLRNLEAQGVLTCRTSNKTTLWKLT